MSSLGPVATPTLPVSSLPHWVGNPEPKREKTERVDICDDKTYYLTPINESLGSHSTRDFRG